MEIEAKNYFKDFNLNFNLLRGLYTSGFEQPSFIQKKILTELASSKNILIESSSSTGKTLSFVIYSLQKISQTKNENVQCLILTHTREAALKIYNIYKDISKYMDIKIHSLLGGTIKDDIQKLSTGIQIVIGTPGRIIDMMNKKILSLNDLSFFVIADLKQIIERDYTKIIENIVNHINENCQKAIFINSEDTYENNNKKFELSEDIKKVLKLKSDVVLLNNLNDKSNKSKLINYRIFQIPLKEEWKFDTLINLYKLMEISQAIIYCNNSSSVESINKMLSDKGFICNLIPEDTLKTISNFKKGYIRILTTTDEISSKVVDPYNNAIIINYEVTKNIDDFIKRVGRNEFFGKEGIIINFITEKDQGFINSLEKCMGDKISELPFELSNIQS